METTAGRPTVLGERIDLGENPLPAFAPLRGTGQVIPAAGVVPVATDWVATDRETVDFVFRHPELFSSAAGTGHLGTTRPLIPLEIDPPDHIQYRRLLDPFFSPTRLRVLEPSLRAQINEFIDGFVDRGSAELLSEFFIPYPTQVFLTMYGLPLEDRPLFLRWKDDMIRGGLQDLQVSQRAVRELSAYMERHFALRDGSGQDLLSQLLAHTTASGGLTVEQVLDITILFVLAGLDTVTTALSLSFAYLARHPERRRLIVENPSAIPMAVEELLRIETPAPAGVRTATADVEVGGVTIHEGQRIFCHLGAANGDPAEYPNADTVDLSRKVNRHVSFGGGIHRCLGSHLARIEVRLVIEEFHRRIPDYHLAPDADLVRVPFWEGLDRLPITFPTADP